MNAKAQGLKSMTDIRHYLLIAAAGWLPFGAAGQNIP
jgi:hypothetical protein